MSQFAVIKERLRKAWAVYVKRPYQLRQIARATTHLHGPLTVAYGPDELIVLCLLQDGELYLSTFVRHYNQLGVKHIFLLDNGSTDQTIALARRHANVTVLRCELPFRDYKMSLRHYLIRRFARPQRWALYVDVDELFDYPYSAQMPLPDLLGYLRAKGYTAVLTHMLDLFPDAPLNQITSGVDDYLPDLHRYYDLSGLTKVDYYFPRNQLARPEMKLYHGGVRQDRFAPENLGILLSKHPLFFLDGRVKPLHVSEHSLRHGVVADFTAVLYHFKFLADFAQRAERAVQERKYYNQSEEYQKYLQAIAKNPALNLRRPTARLLQRVEELVENGLLIVSPDYISWAKKHSSKK